MALAFGNRQLPKLLEGLSASDGAQCGTATALHALRTLDAAMNTQEQKAQAIRLEACKVIVPYMWHADTAVAVSACKALTKLVVLLTGRNSLYQHDGLPALCAMLLQRSPLPAAECIMQMASTTHGSQLIMQSNADVLGSLVQAGKVRHLSSLILPGHELPCNAACLRIAMQPYRFVQRLSRPAPPACNYHASTRKYANMQCRPQGMTKQAGKPSSSWQRHLH